ncbi:IS200/IS605 family accessory protein TnpB-related protein, partial [Streptomyces sp. NPDC058434]
GISIVVVDPAYTSRWGAEHWQKPLNSKNRKTRAIVWGIGPPRPDTAPAGVRKPAPASPDHGHDPCRRTRRERR